MTASNPDHAELGERIRRGQLVQIVLAPSLLSTTQITGIR